MDDAEEGDDGEKRRSVTNREESSEHAQAGVGWRGSSSSKLVISYKIWLTFDLDLTLTKDDLTNDFIIVIRTRLVRLVGRR